MSVPSLLISRYWPAALFLVAAVAGGSWLVAAGLTGKPAAPRTATVFAEPRPLPEFELVDHRNQPFTRASLKGETSLLFFGFTQCPDICPATLQQLAVAREQLAGDSQPLPRIILISVDPERDTPVALARYVGYFGQGVTGVTGSLEALRALAASLGIHFAKTPGTTDDDYQVSHSAAVLVVDPEARITAVFGAPHRVEAFVDDLPYLMATR